MRTTRKSKEDAGVNLTPMLDIVFILLIFFIVTTSFALEYGVDVSRPSQAQDSPDLSQTIAVRVSDSGEITVDERPASPGQVGPLIAAAHHQMRDAPVVVLSARGADAGIVVGVIDDARSAGIERVILAEMAQ